MEPKNPSREPGKQVVKVEHVKKVYRSRELEYTAIHDISVSVGKGEFVTILGASGSGKTTLLDLIGTLDTPTSGRVLIEGTDVAKLNDNQLSRFRNGKIGFVFQSYNLVPYMNALENVTLPLIVDDRNNPENTDFAKRLLQEVGLGEKMHKKPNELSGGEQQRVAIVRALVNKPSILLADEPTGNLDSKTSENVLKLLSRMSKEFGITILMATHDPALTAHSDRSIHIKDGLLERQIVKK